MGITVTAPDAFYDCETWRFTVTVNEPGTDNPMSLTGQRLVAQFVDQDNTFVGVCDSAAGNGSLDLVNASTGVCAFVIKSHGRVWRAPQRPRGTHSSDAVKVYGDLFRLPPGGEPIGIGTIAIDVLPSTGIPTP